MTVYAPRQVEFKAVEYVEAPLCITLMFDVVASRFFDECIAFGFHSPSLNFLSLRCVDNSFGTIFYLKLHWKMLVKFGLINGRGVHPQKIRGARREEEEEYELCDARHTLRLSLDVIQVEYCREFRFHASLPNSAPLQRLERLDFLRAPACNEN